jgi:2-polyprenyl-3-methyl-5-hydroxy-6-metoxy-1,4-benzoquinol methylase
MTPDPVQCVLCGSLESRRSLTSRDLRHGLEGVFEVVICRVCGLARTEPRIDDPESWYPTGYQNHEARVGLADRVSLALLHRSLAGGIPSRTIRRLLATTDAGGELGPGSSVLDVGAGSGHFVGVLQAAGIDACGIEPSARAVAVGQGAGISDLFEGVLDERSLAVHGLTSRRWDVIRFYHTLEHTQDPVRTLQVAARLLTPNGRVVVVVPNFGGLGRRLFRAEWDGLELPRHVHHFTRAALSAVFSEAGLDVTSAHTVAVPGVLAGSLAVWRRGSQARRGWVASPAVQALLLPLEFGFSFARLGEGLLLTGTRALSSVTPIERPDAREADTPTT